MVASKTELSQICMHFNCVGIKATLSFPGRILALTWHYRPVSLLGLPLGNQLLTVWLTVAGWQQRAFLSAVECRAKKCFIPFPRVGTLPALCFSYFTRMHLFSWHLLLTSAPPLFARDSQLVFQDFRVKRKLWTRRGLSPLESWGLPAVTP